MMRQTSEERRAMLARWAREDEEEERGAGADGPKGDGDPDDDRKEIDTKSEDRHKNQPDHNSVKDEPIPEK